MRILVALIILLALGVCPAAAKAPSKAQVGAVGCMSLKAARAAYGDAYLRYRLYDGTRCWYAPGRAMKKPPSVRVASIAPKVAAPPAPAVVPDNLNRVQEALCGPAGCPRFDLHAGPEAELYRALCGPSPCPDFRRFEFGTTGRAP
jgi:hypothetical protein